MSQAPAVVSLSSPVVSLSAEVDGSFLVVDVAPDWRARAPYACTSCHTPHGSAQRQCGACLKYNTVRQRDAGPAYGGPDRSLGATKAIVERRLSTGVAWLDAILGGGLSDYACWILAGEPGCGKTTLSFQIAAGWTHGPALIVSNEVDAEEVAAYANRIGVRRDAIVYGVETSLPTGSAVAKRARLHRAGLVVVDSLNKLDPDASAYLKHWAKRARTPVILISQMNAAGQAAGPKERQHIATMVSTMTAAGEHDPLGRTLRLGKTRHSAYDKLVIPLRKDPASGRLAPPKGFDLDAIVNPPARAPADPAPPGSAAAPRARRAPPRGGDRRGVRPPPRAR